MTQPETLYSSLTTPDDTLLVSTHVHDYVTHLDKNGKTYMIDGGNSYRRASCNGDERFYSITTDDPFTTIRKYLLWGSRGKCGTLPLKRTTLENMATDHIQAVLTYLTEVTKDVQPHKYIKYFKLELEHREV